MKFKPLLIYPETLDVARSNLALHWFFNSFSDLHPDLITSDDHEGIFFKTRMIKSPVIFVSLSYGVNIFKFISMVSSAGIPYLKKDRENGMFPVFICGGIAARLNPQPLLQIFDAVFLGEGECMEKDIREILQMEERDDLFKFLRSLEYSLTEEKTDALPVFAPDRSFFVHSDEKIHQLGNGFGDRYIVEMNRGCTNRCRFCAATYAYRSFRTPESSKVLEYVDDIIDNRYGVALMGTSLADLECFDEILLKCAENKCSISLSSLKVSEINEKRAALLKRCKVRSVTVAIESADELTRKGILKNLSDADIFNALRILKKYDLKAKMYFIAGLPHTDIEEEAQKVCVMLKELEKENLIYDSVLSVAPFTPKPLTPFENERFIDKKEYKRYKTVLKKGVSTLKSRVKLDFFSYDESKLDYLTGVLKGDDFLKFILENSENY